METPPIAFIAVLLVSVLAEITWSRLSGRSVYDLKDALSNLSTMVVNKIIQPAALTWAYLIMSLIEPLQLIELPAGTWTFLAAFIVADLAFYWYHRLSHETPLLWTLHHTHHSSPRMNLITAVRLNWLGKFVSPLFFAPLVLLGFPAEYVAASMALGLLFQFFLHTQAIGKFGGFEGTLLNTPSAHRVHHGSNPKYIDKNYAGVFIFWDRLFGTYEPEEEEVRYGVTSGFISDNPLIVHFQPLWKYVHGEWRREKQVAAENGDSARSSSNQHSAAA